MVDWGGVDGSRRILVGLAMTSSELGEVSRGKKSELGEVSRGKKSESTRRWCGREL